MHIFKVADRFHKVVPIYIFINKNESALYHYDYLVLLLIFYICQLDKEL